MPRGSIQEWIVGIKRAVRDDRPTEFSWWDAVQQLLNVLFIHLHGFVSFFRLFFWVQFTAFRLWADCVDQSTCGLMTLSRRSKPDRIPVKSENYLIEATAFYVDTNLTYTHKHCKLDDFFTCSCWDNRWSVCDRISGGSLWMLLGKHGCLMFTQVETVANRQTPHEATSSSDTFLAPSL